MTAVKLPFMNAYGNITRTLKKIKSAATPERFTQDFLATKLGLKGGSPKPGIPFLKRTGFLGSDGVPTELYKRFRNPTESEQAAAQALKIGYSDLYSMNEYIHDLSDKELMGLIVQTTGFEKNSGTAKAILGSFKALKEFASFEEPLIDDKKQVIEDIIPKKEDAVEAPIDITKRGLNLSYTINLNLPSTSDIAVFNAIFKSLREHLLKD